MPALQTGKAGRRASPTVKLAAPSICWPTADAENITMSHIHWGNRTTNGPPIFLLAPGCCLDSTPFPPVFPTPLNGAQNFTCATCSAPRDPSCRLFPRCPLLLLFLLLLMLRGCRCCSGCCCHIVPATHHPLSACRGNFTTDDFIPGNYTADEFVKAATSGDPEGSLCESRLPVHRRVPGLPQ